jgi:site-specific recombinase XerD
MQEKTHLEAFENHLLGLGKSRATIHTYESDVSMLLRYVNKDISEITYTDVENYLREMKARVQKSSVRHNVYGIKIYLKYLKAYHNNNTIDHFDNIPKEMNLLRPPKPREEKPTRKIEPLTSSEIHKLYEVTKDNPRDYMIMRLFFITLQRKESIFNINISDINFETKEILIHAKGDEEYLITIDDETVKAIREYLKVRETPKDGYVIDNWSRHRYHKDALILNGTGKRPTPHIANPLFKKYACMSGITKRCNPHVSRHSGITYLLDNGIPVKTVMLQSGHKSESVITRYHHPDKKQGRDKVVNLLTTQNEEKPQPQPLPPKKPDTPTDINYAQTPDITTLIKQIETLQSKIKTLETNRYDVSIQ